MAMSVIPSCASIIFPVRSSSLLSPAELGQWQLAKAEKILWNEFVVNYC
jgi:hypothetical protein